MIVLYRAIGPHSLLCLTDAITWLTSSALLYFEYRRKIKQSIFGLRGFWTLNFISIVLSLIFSFQNEELRQVRSIFIPLMMFMFINLVLSFILFLLTIIYPLDAFHRNERFNYFIINNKEGKTSIERSSFAISDLEINELKNRKLNMSNSGKMTLAPRVYSIKLILKFDLIMGKKAKGKLVEEKLDESFVEQQTEEDEKDLSYECSSKKTIDEIINFNENIIIKWKLEHDEICPLIIILEEYNIFLKHEIENSSRVQINADSLNDFNISMYQSLNLSSRNNHSVGLIDNLIDLSPLREVYLTLSINNIWFNKNFYIFLDFKNLDICESATREKVKAINSFSEITTNSFHHDLGKHMFILNSLHFKQKPFSFKLQEFTTFTTMIEYTIKLDKKAIQDKFNIYDLQLLLKKFRGCPLIDQLQLDVCEYLKKDNLSRQDLMQSVKNLEYGLKALLQDGFFITSDLMALLKINQLVSINIFSNDSPNISFELISNFKEITTPTNVKKLPQDQFSEVLDEYNLNEYEISCKFIGIDAGSSADSLGEMRPDGNSMVNLKYNILAASKRFNTHLSWEICLNVDLLSKAFSDNIKKLTVLSMYYTKSSPSFRKIIKQFLQPNLELVQRIKVEYDKIAEDRKSYSQNSIKENLFELRSHKINQRMMDNLKKLIKEFTASLNSIFKHNLYSCLLFDYDIRSMVCIYYISTQRKDSKVLVSSIDNFDMPEKTKLKGFPTKEANESKQSILVEASIKKSFDLHKLSDSNLIDMNDQKKRASDKSSLSGMNLNTSQKQSPDRNSIIETLLKH